MTLLNAHPTLPHEAAAPPDAFEPGLPGPEPLEEEAIGGRRSPLRRCIVTAVVADRQGMIRFVASPEGAVVPDLEGTLPGRGLWVTADREILSRAVARNQFSKAARRKVKVDPDLVDRVEALLKRRCLDSIGLCRRAGVAVSGFEKVREALRKGKAGALVAAADGAEDGRGKMRALAGEAPVVDLFDAADLGHAFGRDHVVHAMLAPGRLAARFLEECRRYAGLRRGASGEGNCGPASAGRATDTTTS
ncbi:RNA-binding protein [Skermanella sp. TT6]|uniref:RNA-binding protein n=1 Tax=Skermanella cutis TaxID=2775420 RepID=A0ABX7B4W4_9PROT|nr:RNA-binding protein [Skermanella sp. TT6]QQP89394.1 RNA-binding protein [Skermanella sp. TT6]